MTRRTTPLTVRYGTPRQRAYVVSRSPRGESPADRIRRHSEVDENGCWVWQLATPEPGYGRITIDGKTGLYAHRVSYEAFVGPIPDGLHIDHLCRNRACCNPEHLEPVTPQINSLRGIGFPATNAKKTECPQGHPYDDENTYFWRNRRGCRTCRAEHMRAYCERQQAKSA